MRVLLVRSVDPAAWAASIVEATSVQSVTFPDEFRAPTVVPKLIDPNEQAASDADR